MRIKIVYIMLFIIQSQILIAQDVFTVSGHVFDKNNGEYLVGATIYNQLTSDGTTTNEYGFFSISIPAGRCNIECSFIGYTTKEISIHIDKDSMLNIGLESKSIDLGEVLITESINDNVKNNEFTFKRISTKDIRQLPSVIGEPDLIKTLQLLSGVKTIGDGSSGMFIRGGSSDQNLIIIDEAPIYNPSHLFGLISVFNTDVLSDIKFYKSNMPAQYGGRASAVIDCKMKEGNLKQNQLTAGISPFSANVSINGPVIKDKSSYLFSLRKSYLDIFLNTGANLALLPAFYDLNAKVNTKLGEKNRLYFSVYNGLDKLRSVDGFYNKWGNKTTTLRWNSILNAKLFSNFSFIYSDYNNYLEFEEEKRNYKWLTGVKDLNAKIDLSWYMKPETVLKFGGGTIYHRFIPGETKDSTQNIPRIQAVETSAYILNDITFSKWLGVNYGLRLSVFQNIGKAEIFNYNNDNEYISTTVNQKGIYNTYWNLEPRVNLNFRMKETLSLKLAYARNIQYMQVLQNNSLSYSSLETWFPANKNIKPLLADIFSLGVFRSIPSGYSVSIETYYKNFKSQIDYVDHATLINNPYIESQTLSGKAKAYGIEFNLKKEVGSLTGSISYNYSKAKRTIKGINNGDEYDSPYDIPHDIKIIGNYSINKNWNFNSAWVFQTGRPVTLPVGFYFYQGDAVPIYTKRNSSRFPNYHRLDISCTYQTRRENKSNWFLTFAIYNLYSRRNPLGYKLVYDYSANSIKGYEYALFTILPSISIRFEI